MMKWKKIIESGMVFLLLISMCACGMADTKDDTQRSQSPVITSGNAVKEEPETSEDGIRSEVEESAQEAKAIDNDLKNRKEITIYSIDEDTAEKVSVTALVPNDTVLTAQLIVDKVTESMADAAFIIGIDSVTQKDDTVIISFKKDQPPVINCGSSVEGAILDSFAQSILDNIPECHKIIYRIMDEPYSSGHFEFGIDEVYMESNH